jgi:hypothetical protein
MFIAVVGRRLRPGASVDDFVGAWYPERGFGVPGRGPILARDEADAREILTLAIRDETVERDRPTAAVGA